MKNLNLKDDIMIIEDNEIDSNIELLTPQSHENVAIIPLKSEKKYIDVLTLKKGLELGLVEVKECEHSTVSTVIVKNNAVTPLILIDGEEIVGGDQNRIVNATTVIAPNSQSHISVSCTERGRWAYKSEFASSVHIADFNTRVAKEKAFRSNRPVQNEVWSSIDALERRNNYHSKTSAMSESYENAKTNFKEILKSFEIVDGQTGVLIIINGEIKGFELFLSSEIYKDFHEKILKSYIIGSDVENMTFTINVDRARQVIENAFDSTFESKPTKGLEKAYEFENQEGIGKAYIFENEIIHLSYFNSTSDNESDEALVNADVNYSVRD